MALHDESYPTPTKTGEIPYKTTGTNRECSTAYNIWGDLNHGVPLICLHGGPGVPSDYLKPMGLLNKQFGIPVVTYDQIGCGQSTHLPEKRGDTTFWDFPLFIGELTNLLSSLNIKQYDLWGHSWGGMIAQKFALTQPAGLRKMILASSPAKVQRRVAVTRRHRALIPGVAEVMEKCEAEGTTASDEYKAASMQYMKRHLCILDPLPGVLITAVQSSTQDDTVFATMYGSVTVQGSMGDFDIESQLQEITSKIVPGGVLITNGEFDSAQDEVVRPQFMLISARTKWIKYPKSSHMPFLEETERFITDLGTFLMGG